MQPSREDIRGKRNTDRRIRVILAYTGRTDGLAVIDLLHELGLTADDRSGVVQNHLEPLVEAGVLEECEVIPDHGKQKRKRKRDAHRLKQDPVVFGDLLEIFIGTEYQYAFLMSVYVGLFDPRDCGVCDAIMGAVHHHIEVAELFLSYFYPDSPLAKALAAVAGAQSWRQHEQMIPCVRSTV
jgi:hypothetical protein